MKELDKMLDALMRAKEQTIVKTAPEEDKEELIGALREQMKNKIIQEVMEEYKEQIIAEANLEIEKRKQQHKVKELRSLMWNGFVVAFVVGLSVNQITDIIGYYKGSVQLTALWPTIIITVILVAICIVLYLYSFLKDALNILSDNKIE